MLGPWEERYRKFQRDSKRLSGLKKFADFWNSNDSNVVSSWCEMLPWLSCWLGGVDGTRNDSLVLNPPSHGSHGTPHQWLGQQEIPASATRCITEFSAIHSREIYGSSWLFIKSWIGQFKTAAGRDVASIYWIDLKTYASMWNDIEIVTIWSYQHTYIYVYIYIHIHIPIQDNV